MGGACNTYEGAEATWTIYEQMVVMLMPLYTLQLHLGVLTLMTQISKIK